MTTRQRKISLLILVRLLIVLLLLSFLPVFVSGRWDWWEGWIYGIISVGSFVAGRGLVALRTPDLIAERANFSLREAKSWDRILAPLVAFGVILPAAVAGLEMRSGGSLPFSLPVEIIALVIILAGMILGNYALIENRFFSGVVRIQTDRGHTVVSTGPYRWIRHPGYAGTLWVLAATPFFLNSIWAILPAMVIAILLVIRTSLEDRTLQEELEGYRDYAKRVHYRLVPGIW